MAYQNGTDANPNHGPAEKCIKCSNRVVWDNVWINFALSLPLDGVTFFTFTPYPNTALRDLAFQNGKVSDKWEHYSGHPSSLPFIPNGMDNDYLLEMQTKAYRKFLLRPNYLLNHLSTFTNRKSIMNGMGFLKALITN